MSERIRGSYDDALYKSTYTLLYFTLQNSTNIMTYFGIPPRSHTPYKSKAKMSVFKIVYRRKIIYHVFFVDHNIAIGK